MWFLLLLPLISFADSEIDLSAVNDLEEILPDDSIQRSNYKNIDFERKNRNFSPPVKVTPLQDILESGKTRAYLRPGTYIYGIKDDKARRVSREVYLKRYKLEDEHGFAYLINKDGTSTYKVPSERIQTLTEEVKLYEPPTRFSPATEIVAKREMDRKLNVYFEGAAYLGTVQSSFMQDLFNDDKASTGVSNQFAFHAFADWKIPIRIGAAVHYERASYDLTGGGQVYYDAISFGPQFRTKDFEFLGAPWRLTTQVRYSPLARANAETRNGDVNFKFNSTDWMTTFERPWDNRWGQFVIGAYYQSQWLNLKDQPEIVSVRASNKTNQSFGLFLGQVF